MRTRHREIFTTIHTEGAILPSDLLLRILERDQSLEGLSPELVQAIAAAYLRNSL